MERPRLSLGSPLPATPKARKSGGYFDLLQQFGTRSSATSVTKARRMTSPDRKADRSVAATPPSQNSTDTTNRRELRARPSLNYAVSALTEDVSSEASAVPTPQKLALQKTDSSGDELAEPVSVPSSNGRKEAKTSHKDEELKMEARKKGKAEAPRRSLRSRKSNIIESDTIDELAQTPIKKKVPLRPKLDTARQRLKDDIATQSKAKANNFLVANKEYFLPLLPTNNHVSKLVEKGDAKPVVEYKALTEQPRGVTATMKPYQLSGLSFLVHLYNNGFSGILGDEMGLGKTLQTLSLFQYLEEQDQDSGSTSEELRPYLVICPLSVLNSWVTEAQKWVPNLKVLRYHGTVKERDRLKRVALGLEDMHGNETNQSKSRKASRKAGLAVSKLSTEDRGAESFKIVVTTYEAFQSEQSWFKHSFIWRYVVLDEGHRIKNNVTNISSCLKGISAEYRLILTGTPLQNNLTEMWALLAWLYPDVFTSNTNILFKEAFDLTRGKVNKETMDDARRLLELIMLRRMKDTAGVNLNLPPKEEVLLYVPLTPMQRFWYMRLLTRVDEAMLQDLFTDAQGKEKSALQREKAEDEKWKQVEKLENDKGESGGWEETAAIMKETLEKEQANTGAKTAWTKLMNLVIQLRKCCSHPYLLPGAVPDPYYLGQHVIRASGKFILLEKLLKHTIYNAGKKVLIFSGFTRTLDCCEELLDLIGKHGQGFKYLRLDGSTARARRNLEIRMFNNPDSDYKVMLLSTRAGGLGINLTAAEDVIFLDEDWNPQITLQAEARAHRIGQTKKVTIYKLCTQGTVEEQMMGRIRKKLYLSAKITESMRNIHDGATKAKGPSVSEDMPQMDTTQLKTLLRRGAQTLSHPEINVTEMLSWDLDTMLANCRDKPADPQANPEGSTELDEQKWLSVMERVECAVFDGKRHQRRIDKPSKGGASTANILPDTISREDRRKGKNTTVVVDGYAVSKESLNCGDWEAVPTLAGKDPRLADPKREKRRELQHEQHCLACFDQDGDLLGCKGCPRSYHYDCLAPEFQAKLSSAFGGFHCAQHECFECAKKTSDAGGLIFRCRWCERGFCEDCLDWGKEDLIGENLPEFEMLGEIAMPGGFYIKCPACKEGCEEDEERKAWLMTMEASYKEQHGTWLKNREKERKRLEKEQDALRRQQKHNNPGENEPPIEDSPTKGRRHQAQHTKEPIHHQHYEDQIQSQLQEEHSRKHHDNVVPKTDNSQLWTWNQSNHGFVPFDEYRGSPPALTDTSLPTPAAGDSGVSTPMAFMNGSGEGTKRKPLLIDDDDYETREGKRARPANHAWQMESDPLLRDLTIHSAQRGQQRRSRHAHHP
ncbi:hypothetical protein K491DRAFT_216268 [Lophiostoma macrostomum CBS 122681]|uniref:ISWI chromatin-remodeling complex ATPase ISW2 n=1 Tax=Lophiostoma macrostomum CBS 122681 TaxID=1314788 RepID=A0A6A6TKJ6_9PLEO|nr:hypothetical protein K491DRAFT_216268 [Lophiostoma macrostomum CBS 122681]